MQIREGAYYRTRGGDVVGPMCHGEPGSHFPWITLTRCWTMAGMVFCGEERHENCMDLISEVYVSDTPPTVQETEADWRAKLLAAGPGPFFDVHDRKTLRDEFAMAALQGLLTRESDLALNVERYAYEYADVMMEARKK